MIADMKLLTIKGEVNDFDRIILKYLSHYPIQYTPIQNSSMNHLNYYSFELNNPYTHYYDISLRIISNLDTNQPDIKMMEIQDAINFIITLNERIVRLNSIEENPLLFDDQSILSILYAKRLEILSAYKTISFYKKAFDIRKYGLILKSEVTGNELFLLQGFIPTNELGHLAFDLQVDSKVEANIKTAQPFPNAPTKLQNPMILQPFENFTKQYCLPPYNGSDFTFFVASMFILSFGILFGNLLIGLLLCFLGSIYRSNNNNLFPRLLKFSGIVSFIFGLIYLFIIGWYPIPLLICLTKSWREQLILSILFASCITILFLTIILFHCIRQRSCTPHENSHIVYGILSSLFLFLLITAYTILYTTLMRLFSTWFLDSNVFLYILILLLSNLVLTIIFIFFSIVILLPLQYRIIKFFLLIRDGIHFHSYSYKDL